MNKVIIAVIGVFIVVGGVYAYSTGQKEVAMTGQELVSEEKMLLEKEIMEEEETVILREEASVMEKEEVMAKSGSYEAYSGDKIAMAANGDVVIFFHASWCPSCRGLNSDIEKNLNAIPTGVTILKVDYDKETELKKKYGVTTQHTLVQVDKDGNLIKKWSGGSKLENLLSQIQ